MSLQKQRNEETKFFHNNNILLSIQKQRKLRLHMRVYNDDYKIQLQVILKKKVPYLA